MATRSTLEGQTILLVDDDKDVREAIADALGQAGCTVITAANGVEALELLRRGARPHAMLVDLDMPLMDGRTFCETCDRDSELWRIPRVLLTANPYAAFFHSRAWMVLAKPVDMSRVVESLSTVLGSHRLAA